jgi:hypothetical protein
MDSQACLTDNLSKAMAERLGVRLLATDSNRRRINRAREEATVLRRHLRVTEIFGYFVASLYACVYLPAWTVFARVSSDVQMQKRGNEVGGHLSAITSPHVHHMLFREGQEV